MHRKGGGEGVQDMCAGRVNWSRKVAVEEEGRASVQNAATTKANWFPFSSFILFLVVPYFPPICIFS